MLVNRQAALVTGSSRGIGLAAAIELAREGFAVAMNGPDDDDEFAAAADRVRGFDVPVVTLPFDVGRTDLHDDALQRAESVIGPLTTLVNNAGVGVLDRGDVLEVTEESFDRCMAINAKAVFFLSQCFAKRLLARERDPSAYHSLINVTSSNAVAVALPRSEYAASKAAAAMISKTFAVRLGRENIAVFDVQPGLIDTMMTAPAIESYRNRARDGLTLLPRVGTPEEMGRIIASLATGRLPYMTGQAISADAGLLVPRF